MHDFQSLWCRLHWDDEEHLIIQWITQATIKRFRLPCVSCIPQLVLHIADMCIHGKSQTSKKKYIYIYISIVIYKYNTVVVQAPLSMGFSRQEYRSGLLVPPPRDLPSPGIEPGFPALQPDFFLPFELPGKPINESRLSYSLKCKGNQGAIINSSSKL